MADHDLEARDHLSKWDRSILLPRLNVLDRVNEDDEVLLLALVEYFDLLNVSTRHLEFVVRSRLAIGVGVLGGICVVIRNGVEEWFTCTWKVDGSALIPGQLQGDK